jgi:hypothetical protein
MQLILLLKFDLETLGESSVSGCSTANQILPDGPMRSCLAGSGAFLDFRRHGPLRWRNELRIRTLIRLSRRSTERRQRMSGEAASERHRGHADGVCDWAGREIHHAGVPSQYEFVINRPSLAEAAHDAYDSDHRRANCRHAPGRRRPPKSADMSEGVILPTALSRILTPNPAAKRRASARDRRDAQISRHHSPDTVSATSTPFTSIGNRFG